MANYSFNDKNGVLTVCWFDKPYIPPSCLDLKPVAMAGRRQGLERNFQASLLERRQGGSLRIGCGISGPAPFMGPGFCE